MNTPHLPLNPINFLIDNIEVLRMIITIALLVVFLATMYVLFGRKKSTATERRHKFYIDQSKRVLKSLKEIQEPYRHAKQMAYLKSINPYVFEELILTALQEQNHVIKRNVSYSGDGGLDGLTIIDNEPYLIQAKRYQDHIKISHLREFELLCEQEQIKGLFVHTGKTTKSHFKMFNNFEIISGSRLLKMLGVYGNQNQNA